MFMSQFLFGAGFMYCIPKVQTPTPRLLGTMQDASIEFSSSIKELYGQMQYAEATARGQQKVQGKAKFAQIKIDTYNELYFNETVTPGMNLVSINEAHTISDTDNTIIPKKDTEFATDLGVIDALTGKAFTRVSGSPQAGEYQLDPSNAEYLFNVTDTKKAVYLSYIYTVTDIGKTIVINNQPMGEAPTFMGVFNGRFSGKQITLILNSCMASKLSLIGTKSEDFSIPEFDFAASVDAGGVLGTLSAAE